MPSKNIVDFANQIKTYMRGAEVVAGKNLAYSQENNAVIATIENGKSYKVRWTGSATVTLKKNSASGTEVTSGSTSPLSFTADSDFDLYFGSSADVTEIMVYDGNDTSDTYEPYYVPVKDSMFKRSEQGVLGAKNLLPNLASADTTSGVTVTINSDKSVTLNTDNNGATGNVWVWLNGSSSDNYTLKKGKYTWLCKTSSAITGVNSQIISGEYPNDVHYTGNGELNTEHTFELSSDTVVRYGIRISQGTVLSNVTFYPMLRIASDPDDTYQPYAMTNRELTEAYKTAESACTSPLGTVDINKLYKRSGMVTCNLFSNGITANAWAVLATIPTGYRPATGMEVRIASTDGRTYFIYPTGETKTDNALSSENIRLYGMWMTAD